MHHLTASFLTLKLKGGSSSSPASFVGDVINYPIKIRVQRQNSLPFYVRLINTTATLSAYFRYCAVGINSYPTTGIFLGGETQILLLDTLGKRVSGLFASVSASDSQISSDGACFTAHATIANITGEFTLSAVEVIFRSLEPSNCSGSLEQCYNRRSYYPLRPQLNGVVLSTTLPWVLAQNEEAPELIAFQVRDLQPPVWIGCPDNQIVLANTGSPNTTVSWVVPFVTDNVAIASVDSEISDYVGISVTKSISVREAVHTFSYSATDTSGLSSSCT